MLIFATSRSPAARRAIEACLPLGIAHHGRLRDGLVDCLGMMLGAHESGGVRYDQRPFHVEYDRYWFRRNPCRLRDGLLRLGWSVVRKDVREFDVLLAGTVTKEGDHPMVYVGAGELLHALPRGARLSDVASREGAFWLDRVKLALRPRCA